VSRLRIPLESIRARRTGPLAVTLALLASLTACGSGYESQVKQQEGTVTLQVLIGSGTTAETRITRELTGEWAARTGNKVQLVRAAELEQQLGQSFAGGSPPDLFYLAPASFSRYADSGSLHAYGSKLKVEDDIYPNLREIFSQDDRLYCAPKDFSTLALMIDTDAWKEAGLTEADIPTTWAELATVAEKLTTGKRVGLAFDDTTKRIGVFMKQSGGWFVDESGRKATVDTLENLRALRYVQKLLSSGSAAFSSTVDAGWGGEALGKGSAAMTIEGAWAVGALDADFPDRNWRAVELPKGPAGEGTLSFTNCWGIPERSDKQKASVSLVNHLMSERSQRRIGDAMGVIPANEKAAAGFGADNPEFKGFLDGAPYAQGELTGAGLGPVQDDFDAQLLRLTKGEDPKKMLARVQRNAEQALKGADR